MTQFLHRALIPVRHHSWFHLALSISHNQFGPSSGFQDRFILEAIHSSTLCFRSVWGSTWCVFFEEIFHYLRVCTWSMVRGARLNGSDWSESRCLKRRVDPWGHLCSSCNYSVIPCDSGPVHHLFTAWQSHLLVHTSCESDNIRESRKKRTLISLLAKTRAFTHRVSHQDGHDGTEELVRSPREQLLFLPEKRYV